jgi:decaprenylphospho-beta-D-erythro-pentofuranosid-2-ulose 2-reductase
VNHIIVFGASSRIAQEYCRIAAARHDLLFLVGRNETSLQAIASDLRIRGSRRVAFCVADLDDLSGHERIVEQAESELEGLTHALVAHGVLPDQQAATGDFRIVERTILTNFTSVASICERLARRFAEKRRGVIAVIGSVSGDRGRGSAYVYGATKAAVETYLSGLRNRLAHDGVTVITIKPGFVDTPMTAHLRKNLLFASARTAALAIDRAVERRNPVVYVPWFWRWIMLVVRALPERLFMRMTL